MPPGDEGFSDDAARAIWRRAAELQAAAERRMEERTRALAERTESRRSPTEGIPPEEVQIAATEAGISPEFVQIAMAEAAASGSLPTPLRSWDVLGARLFLGASKRAIELTTVVPGSLGAVTEAVVRVFSGHPCLLQPREVTELGAAAGRVVVFGVPKYDWIATANPPFVEKAATIGLRQLHVAIRALSEESACEVVAVGDLHPGVRTRWRLSALTSVGATAVGGAAGVGIAGSAAITGAILILPALAGAAAVSGLAIGLLGAAYRYYRSQVEGSLRESLGLLEASARAASIGGSQVGSSSVGTGSLSLGEIPRALGGGE